MKQKKIQDHRFVQKRKKQVLELADLVNGQTVQNSKKTNFIAIYGPNIHSIAHHESIEGEMIFKTKAN